MSASCTEPNHVARAMPGIAFVSTVRRHKSLCTDLAYHQGKSVTCFWTTLQAFVACHPIAITATEGLHWSSATFTSPVKCKLSALFSCWHDWAAVGGHEARLLHVQCAGTGLTCDHVCTHQACAPVRHLHAKQPQFNSSLSAQPRTT